jgi:hypothetical protein
MSSLSTPAECADFFVKTLKELNAVTHLQMRGILDLTIAGVEAAKSLRSSTADQATAAKLGGLVDELKGTADKLSQGSPKEFSAGAPQSENFCAEVEANINIAMRNCLANQEQLNIIGAAALTQIITLLTQPS